ncbi:hypothetical protein GGQ08_002428 [Salinibacter ruber]|uniref:hypothetical protein n=1 Tax=Salinibacter ruber TaxID=146919 RepID=UPI002167627E|nr:hypothetical protein [Salinibacter ruber]MCS3651720.1 hypothetical protein [Salinibacter ruber]MCS3654352.1 hypothetical protein [Salinibacter ruber]
MSRVKDVFVAGGQPTVTYNPREQYDLEGEVEEYLETGYKLLSISGPTKSGKTVLVRRFIAREEGYWVYGGQVDSIDTFWEIIVEQGGAFTNKQESETDGKSSQTTSKSTGGVKPGGIGVSGTYENTKSESSASSEIRGRSVSPSVAAVQMLEKEMKPVVIDDFHYIERDLQGEIIRTLKNLIFDGLPVIILSVPHRAFDAVRVETEMTGRLMQLPIPEWSNSELEDIAVQGFDALNVKADKSLTDRLVKESFKSPHLMQDFCNAICRKNDIYEEQEERKILEKPSSWDSFFGDRASTTSKAAFDRLAKGPRQRSDRIQRPLENGESCDIYEAILIALAETGPKTKLSYEEIRSKLQKVLTDNIPQAHEITRVLDKMSEIAQDELQGEPVVDWDKDLSELYISDPYFAYYLRWGTDIG